MRDVAKADALPDLEAWVIAQVGDCPGLVCHAEVDIPGWQERPWVRVRALTDHEALERESIGVRDAYVPSADDGVVCERTYNFAAMGAYDLAHSVVGFWLPTQGADGEVVPVNGEGISAEERAALMRRLPQALGQWVRECVDRVNLRRPEDQSGLAIAKKELGEAGKSVALSGQVDLRTMLFAARELVEQCEGATLREGHEFYDQEQVPAWAQGDAKIAPVGGANVVRLVRQVVRELLIMEITGQMPGGRDWCRQPWWRVGLWEAFWQGHAQAGGDAACWAMTVG